MNANELGSHVRRGAIGAAIVGLAVACVAPVSAASEAVTATAYDVAGEGVHVVYEAGAAGENGAKPRLTYATPSETLTFTGPQIRVVPSTDVGTLVSVSLRRTIDTGSTSLTLLIPRVGLTASERAAPVAIVATTTVHRFSVVPRFEQGQLDTYTHVTLTGTASATTSD